jgi:hypothetical protein
MQAIKRGKGDENPGEYASRNTLGWIWKAIYAVAYVLNSTPPASARIKQVFGQPW